MNADEVCKELQSSERRTKISQFEELQKFCDNSNTAEAQLINIFDECYLHMLKCYSDRYESVRDQAVQTVSAFIQRLPPNDFHLLNIVSTLVERMGQVETTEESEEIRRLYVKQLHLLLKHYVDTGNAHNLQESYADIVRILMKAIRDAYPAVQREACACVVILAKAADAQYFQQHAEKLAVALYTVLNHKHSLTRIATIQALEQVALKIDASGDALSRLLMEVSPLLMDSMPLVRRECGELGVLLLLELRDRYSYFEKVIPLVLCCLKDDSPDVVNYIRPLWVKCGKQFYEENETELSKQELADLPVENYPIDVQRPTIGCRGVVQRSLRLLQLITRESSDWKENVRLHSHKLLYQFVLHAEAAMTAKFFEIYGDVARACRDNESAVVKEAVKVSDLMGRLFCYDDWCEHGFDGLAKNAGKEGYLKCFYYMYTAALGAKWEDVLRVSRLLIATEFSQTLKPEFQMYVLMLVETLLDKASAAASSEMSEDGNEELNKNIYISTIKVMALSYEYEQTNSALLQDKGNNILLRLTQRLNITSDDLHEKYFTFALEYAENLDAPLDALSEPVLLLDGLINICKLRGSYLKQLQAKILIVWEHCGDEAKVKIFTAVSVAMLDWQNTFSKDDVSENTELLLDFTVNIIEPHVMWQAGANAEAMRSLATATLCAMSQGAREEAQQVLLKFAKYWPNLLEDRSVATRHYAVKCVFNLGELPLEQLKPIAYATLQRLDDPSAGIRELAVVAIPKLTPKFGQNDNTELKYEHDIWEMFIRKAVDMLFLHYEGPEIRLQTAIKGTIQKLAQKYPEICKDSYIKTMAMSYSESTVLKELQADLPFAA